MNHKHVPWRFVALVMLALVGLGSCFAEGSERVPTARRGEGGGRDVPAGGVSGEGGAGAGAGGAPDAPMCVARPAVEGAECLPAVSGEPLLARIVEDVPKETLYFTDTLFGEFNSLCGSCHVASNLGAFHVTRTSFPTVVGPDVLTAMRSEAAACDRDDDGVKRDPSCFAFMPPVGSPSAKPWAERKDNPNDPVTRLVGLIQTWVDAGRPADAFTVPPDLSGTSVSYAIDADSAQTFTNIGTCIPDPGMVATELERSCQLDAMFAGLEKHIDSTVPNEQLGLPSTLEETDLFTLDSAELARHGVVAYAPTYPLWSDNAGKLRYIRVPQGQSVKFNKKTQQFDIPKNTRFYKTFLKKILDRDGVERFRKIETRLIVSRPGEDSLFGTYQWNEDETEATLVTDPLNNGFPFKDKLLTVVTDLAKADAIKQQWMDGKVRNYSKELDYAGVVRRYAIPGSERCIQCHMGGYGQSFVLGFTPLQLHARPCDPETLESEGHCDGGIIEPVVGDQVTQLERFISYGIITDYDISSQLVSLEDAQGTRAAPRTSRTEEELVAQGYMLGNCMHCHNPDGYPSVLSPELKPLLNFRPGKEGGIFGFPLERFSPRILRAQGSIPLPYITPSLRDIVSTSLKWTPKKQIVTQPGKPSQIRLIDAPWRSLIYRNVDTPFVYSDDATIYPHMPLNTPGFDCRAPRILGEWMVSLPALRKHPELIEDDGDNDPQPYYEVFPSDPNYLNSVAQAQKRLATYRGGLRNKAYCPDTSDIVDVWDIVYGGFQIPPDGVVKGLPSEGVPDRPHWVVTDLTDPPGEWNPRRTDWKSIVVNQDFTDSEKSLADMPAGPAKKFEIERVEREKKTVQMLQTVGLSPTLKDFVEKEIPLGLWLNKPECDFSNVKKVGDYVPPERPRWMNFSKAAPTAPVYQALPGAAVYQMICINCHGIAADSTGRQASTLQEMTGGLARVANFKNGLFGPMGSGGENRQRVFGSDDLTRRYLMWMALGGTRTQIPSPILDLVAGTPVLGTPRAIPPAVTTANMLDSARSLCAALITRGEGEPFSTAMLNNADDLGEFQKISGLILSNGDSELWAKLCTIDNPSPIHAILVQSTDGGPSLVVVKDEVYAPGAYPVGEPIGDYTGHVSAHSAGSLNDFPWCIKPPAEPELAAYVAGLKAIDGVTSVPVCPAALITEENRWKPEGMFPDVHHPQLEEWSTRGAMNAGMAVFSYLDRMISQGKGHALGFAECEKLGQAAP